MALRWPEWCEGISLPEEGFTAEEKDGYFYLSKEWTDSDEFTVTLPLRVRILAADTRVREDVGKAAFTYGPWVYCLEEKDNGKDLHLLSLPKNIRGKDVKTSSMEIDGRPVISLKTMALREEPVTGRGLYYEYSPAVKKPVEITLIPYYAWANRGENEMQVYTRLE